MNFLRTSRHLLTPVFLFLSILIHPISASASNDKLCKADIQSVIKSYEKALNNSNVSAIIKHYSNDGIFMPSSKPTAQGKAQVEKAYEHVFDALDLKVSFHFDEIVRRGDIAFVRTTSDGKIKLLKKNQTIINNSRELFVMKRIDGDWKIYRYMFNES